MYKQISGKNLIIVIFAIVLILMGATLSADKACAASTATVNNPIGINVRSGPGTDYSILFTLQNKVTVEVLESSGIWYKISYNGRVGYAHSDNLLLKENPDYIYNADFEAHLTKQGFPESYKDYLRKLHASHPNWVFKAQNTGLEWSSVIEKESRVPTNLVHTSSPDSWKSRDYGAYDPDTGKYIVFDSGGWVAASRSIVEYYMDPRNFLKEGSIFQFMTHSYDASTQTKEGLQKLVAGSFLANKFPEAGYDTYSDALIYAGQQANANPYVLASMILVEQGTNGVGNSISGKVPGYEGYYNYFNVRAYASGGYDAVEYGLIYAKGSGSYGRPWNSRIKSIVGGAMHYASNYINNNQNTLYLKKFNVMNGLNSVSTHQYMTNVGGAASEASNLAKGYDSNDAVTFYIPVYKNMPAAACPTPGSGSNDYFLKSLSVNGYNLMPAFNMYTSDYELVVPSSTSSITVNAAANDSAAKVSGTGTISLTSDVTTVKITVTSTGGTAKTYTITVARETAPVDTKPVSSKYNVGTYITGVDFNTSVNTFKSNISAPSGHTLKVADAGGKEKTSGNVGTGCRVLICNSKGSIVSDTAVVVKGDTNGDGKVSSADVLFMQRYIIKTYSLTGAYFSAADINNDGKIASADVLYAQRHILGTYTIKN